MAGFIKLDRKIRQWEWYKDTATKCVFIELLLRAAYCDYNFKGIPLKSGQCTIGRKELAEATGLSEKNVRTALEHLKMTGEITVEAASKYSVVTIEKWAFYQGDTSKGGQQVASKVASKTASKKTAESLGKTAVEKMGNDKVASKTASKVATIKEYKKRNIYIGGQKSASSAAEILPPKIPVYEPDNTPRDIVPMPDNLRERLERRKKR